ncbi:MAG TPA: hypothetical protein VFV01_29360 [Spirillospora sp.]|nr:hypothetical protein [Spirillospora sp.]
MPFEPGTFVNVRTYFGEIGYTGIVEGNDAENGRVYVYNGETGETVAVHAAYVEAA